MRTISLNIHQHTWLSSIKIAKHQKGSKTLIYRKTMQKIRTVHIQAKTQKSEDIMHLVRVLSRSPLLSNIKLDAMQKTAPTVTRALSEPKSRFTFSISGNLKLPKTKKAKTV